MIRARARRYMHRRVRVYMRGCTASVQAARVFTRRLCVRGEREGGRARITRIECLYYMHTANESLNILATVRDHAYRRLFER